MQTPFCHFVTQPLQNPPCCSSTAFWGVIHKSTPVKHKHMLFPQACSSPGPVHVNGQPLTTQSVRYHSLFGTTSFRLQECCGLLHDVSKVYVLYVGQWKETKVQANRKNSIVLYPSRYYTVRGQSNVWRLPKYWSPAPSLPSECVTPVFGEGGGGGGSIFWKTPDTALYSTYVSTLWPYVSADDSCVGARDAGVGVLLRMRALCSGTNFLWVCIVGRQVRIVEGNGKCRHRKNWGGSVAAYVCTLQCN